jgi:DNA-binding response OmpR family regulator
LEFANHSQGQNKARNSKWPVSRADSLEHAREVLNHHPTISLVVLDVGLQDGNGQDLIPELQARHIPIVITTGKVLSMSGDDPVLLKQYHPNELLKCIEVQLKRSRAAQ